MPPPFAAILTDAELAVFDFARGANAMNVPTAAQIAATLADLRQVQGEALLIGGLAVIHYGYERTTQDIDLLYANPDTAILRRLGQYFRVVRKAKNEWHELVHRQTGVRLELIPEGGLTVHGFIPAPRLVRGENGFVSLPGLIWLKLVSGRAKDEADIVELLKPRMDQAPVIREQLPPELHPRLDQLLARATNELTNDPHRQQS